MTKAKTNASMNQRTKDAVIKKITDKKDLKYNYPKSCDDLKSRKKFRHQVRAKVQQLGKKVAQIMATPKAKRKGLAKANKALDTYQAKVMKAA